MITYPLALPSTPGPRSIEWSPFSAVAAVVSPFTLQAQVQAHQGQAWAARVTLPPMIERIAAPWIAALLSLNGRQGTFLWGDAVRRTPSGLIQFGSPPSPGGFSSGFSPDGFAVGVEATNVPMVKGAGQTGQSLLTDGWPASTQGLLIGGMDWIQLGGSGGAPARLYRVLGDVNSNSAGESLMEIWPRLRESPADDALVGLFDCKGTFRLRDNLMDFSVSVAKHYGLELDIIEAL